MEFFHVFSCLILNERQIQLFVEFGLLFKAKVLGLCVVVIIALALCNTFLCTHYNVCTNVVITHTHTRAHTRTHMRYPVSCIYVSIHLSMQVCITSIQAYTQFVYLTSWDAYIYYRHHVHHICMSMTLVRVYSRACPCQYYQYSIMCMHVYGVIRCALHRCREYECIWVQLFLLLAWRSFYANILQGYCNYLC